MKVLDPGHTYYLRNLDPDHISGEGQRLIFVKRNHPPEKFPGNVDAYPGTTSQEVIRALLERQRYVDHQAPCRENKLVIEKLRDCLYLLEYRAHRVRGHALTANIDQVEKAEPCPSCHHVFCRVHAPSD